MSVALTVRSDQWSDDRKSIAGRFQLQRYKQRYRLLEYKVHSRKRRATTQSWSFLEQRPNRKTKRRERQSDVGSSQSAHTGRESERRSSDEASFDPPLSRLARPREAPASIRRVRRASAGAARRGAGERDNRADVFAVLQLARSTQRRVLHLVQSPLSLAPSRSHSRPARRASPHRPLFYCQPTILTCARNVRSTKVFMEISFRMRLARLLARERQYKSTITNGRVN